jgi:hypothetical protein
MFCTARRAQVEFPCTSGTSAAIMRRSAFKLQYPPRPRSHAVVYKMKRHFTKNLLPLGICLSLCSDGWISAARAQNIPARIDIIVVEGEGVTGSVRQKLAHDPVVRIEDDDHRPVAGAAVVFVLPVSGTSGEFEGGSKSLTVVTDNDGVAAARGIRTNQIPGKLQIYVTASYRGLRARGLITQIIEAAPGVKTPAVTEMRASKSGSGKWKWILLGVAAGAGAGAGIYYGTRTSNNPVSIGTGTVVFGSPR